MFKVSSTLSILLATKFLAIILACTSSDNLLKESKLFILAAETYLAVILSTALAPFLAKGAAPPNTAPINPPKKASVWNSGSLTYSENLSPKPSPNGIIPSSTIAFASELDRLCQASSADSEATCEPNAAIPPAVVFLAASNPCFNPANVFKAKVYCSISTGSI